MSWRCSYAEMDWFCCLPNGHTGPHESEPLRAAMTRPSEQEVKEAVERLRKESGYVTGFFELDPDQAAMVKADLRTVLSELDRLHVEIASYEVGEVEAEADRIRTTAPSTQRREFEKALDAALRAASGRTADTAPRDRVFRLYDELRAALCSAPRFTQEDVQMLRDGATAMQDFVGARNEQHRRFLRDLADRIASTLTEKPE